MAGETFPNGNDDFITDEVQGAHEKETKYALESYYSEYTTAFRARVFELMFRNGAMHDGTGWAVFNLLEEEKGGGVALSEGASDVLIRAHPKRGAKEIDGKPVPDIHIITNEEIIGLNGIHSWLVYDFTLDAEDDTQYLVDCFVPENDEGRLMTKYGAFFWIDPSTNQLTVINRPRNYFTARVDVHQDGKKVSPFGSLPNLEDKFHSIETAREILDKIEHLAPAYIAAPNT